MDRVQNEAPQLTDEEKDWVVDNLARQETRFADIVAEMDRIAPDRDAWIEGFLERIQTRGFNYNCDLLRQIPDDEIPVKPARAFKVNF
jgi:hypothetical protein